MCEHSCCHYFHVVGLCINLPTKSVPTLDIAYGDAGWNEQSSLIGSLSAKTLPNTSDDEHICIVASAIPLARFK